MPQHHAGLVSERTKLLLGGERTKGPFLSWAFHPHPQSVYPVSTSIYY